MAKRAAEAVRQKVLGDASGATGIAAVASSSSGYDSQAYIEQIKNIIREDAECIEAVNYLSRILKKKTESERPALSEVRDRVAELNREQEARNLPRPSQLSSSSQSAGAGVASAGDAASHTAAGHGSGTIWGNRGPKYSSLNSRILIIRTPKIRYPSFSESPIYDHKLYVPQGPKPQSF